MEQKAAQNRFEKEMHLVAEYRQKTQDALNQCDLTLAMADFFFFFEIHKQSLNGYKIKLGENYTITEDELVNRDKELRDKHKEQREQLDGTRMVLIRNRAYEIGTGLASLIAEIIEDPREIRNP